MLEFKGLPKCRAKWQGGKESKKTELSEVYHKTTKVGMRNLGTGAGSKHRA